jgi:ATP dependent DNA ligase domain
VATGDEPAPRRDRLQPGEGTYLAADTCRMAISIKRLPAGFVIRAQPVLASKPPSGADWVHEIKHDGYRILVRRDGPVVRLYSRNAYDWTVRLAAIATAAESIKAKSFTIDGEAVVLGPDGLSRFEELSRREAARTAILYAFDIIEHEGEDLRHLPFLDRKAALARCCATPKLASCLTNTLPRMAPPSLRTLVSLAPRVSFPRGLTVPIDPARAAPGLRSAIPPASPRSGRGARFGIDEPHATRASGEAMTCGKGEITRVILIATSVAERTASLRRSSSRRGGGTQSAGSPAV